MGGVSYALVWGCTVCCIHETFDGLDLVKVYQRRSSLERIRFLFCHYNAMCCRVVCLLALLSMGSKDNNTANQLFYVKDMLYITAYSRQLRHLVDSILLPAIIIAFTLEHFAMYATGYMLHLIPELLIALTIRHAWKHSELHIWSLFGIIIGSIMSVALLEVTFHLYKNIPFDERGPVTAASVMLLVACSITAGKIYRQRTAGEAFSITSTKLIWLLMAVGFTFLALDEKVLIHEGLDRMIYRGSGMAYSSFSERIDDFIVLGYAFVGMGCVYWYRHEILRYKKTVTVLCIGFVVLVLHSGLDMAGRPDFVINVLKVTQNPTQIAHYIDMAEEICKLMAEACFLSGLLLALKSDAHATATGRG